MHHTRSGLSNLKLGNKETEATARALIASEHHETQSAKRSKLLQQILKAQSHLKRNDPSEQGISFASLMGLAIIVCLRADDAPAQ